MEDFKSLQTAVNKFNFDYIEIQKTTKNLIEQLQTRGLDIESSEIFFTNYRELIHILPDGSIVKSIIHIVNISNNHWNNELPKFHIYFCKTIRHMRKYGRGRRYRASLRNDGTFYIIKDSHSDYKKLEICANCLEIYNENYDQHDLKSNFNIKNYLNKDIVHTDFIDVDLDICSIPKIYSKNWSKISHHIKTMNHYVCSNCKYDCSQDRLKKFLHTHHKNADKSDNRKSNLQALCIECHADQFQHGHIKSHLSYKQFIKIKRREQ